MTNYAAAPFMLLGVRRSLEAWGVLGWYGHVAVFGALAFFSAGGAGFLKGVQAKRVKKAEGKVAAANGSGASTPGTPGEYTMAPVDAALKEVDARLR